MELLNLQMQCLRVRNGGGFRQLAVGFVQRLALGVRKKGTVRGRESGKRADSGREVSGKEKGSKCRLSEDDKVVDGRQSAKAVEESL